MVLVNYEGKLKQLLASRITNEPALSDRMLVAAKSQHFYKLVLRIYEYCDEMNNIEKRQSTLRKETKDLKRLAGDSILQPKLLESEVQKVKNRTKEFGQAYSMFLLHQPRFRTKNTECLFYEQVIGLIVDIISRVFSEEDMFELKKQINRLFRTNSFNTKLCYEELQKTGQIKKELVHGSFIIQRDVNFSKYRHDIRHQSSQIKPYLNNRSCVRTKETRSPAISLLYPTTEYQVFNFERRKLSTAHRLKDRQ